MVLKVKIRSKQTREAGEQVLYGPFPITQVLAIDAYYAVKYNGSEAIEHDSRFKLFKPA